MDSYMVLAKTPVIRHPDIPGALYNHLILKELVNFSVEKRSLNNLANQKIRIKT